MTILVVDDSRVIQLGIEKALREAGYDTMVAADGDAGLRAAAQQLPDLILLDIMLPNIPGTSVLRGLKANPTTRPIPVIVLTSLGGVDSARLKEDGADCYFPKSDLDIEGGCQTLIDVVDKTLTKTYSHEATDFLKGRGKT